MLSVKTGCGEPYAFGKHPPSFHIEREEWTHLTHLDAVDVLPPGVRSNFQLEPVGGRCSLLGALPFFFVRIHGDLPQTYRHMHSEYYSSFFQLIVVLSY